MSANDTGQAKAALPACLETIIGYILFPFYHITL